MASEYGERRRNSAVDLNVPRWTAPRGVCGSGLLCVGAVCGGGAVQQFSDAAIEWRGDVVQWYHCAAGTEGWRPVTVM